MPNYFAHSVHGIVTVAGGIQVLALEGENMWSSGIPEVAISSENVPEPPANISATPLNVHIRITFDAVIGATSYNLYWGTAPGITTASTKIAGITSPYLHHVPEVDITYYYAMTALNEIGESEISAEVYATSDAVLADDILLDGGLEYWVSDTQPSTWQVYTEGTSTINLETETTVSGFCARLDIDEGNSLAVLGDLNYGQSQFYVTGSTEYVLSFSHMESLAGKTMEYRILVYCYPTDTTYYLQADGTWAESEHSFTVSSSQTFATVQKTFITDAAYVDGTYLAYIGFRNLSAAGASIYVDSVSLLPSGGFVSALPDAGFEYQSVGATGEPYWYAGNNTVIADDSTAHTGTYSVQVPYYDADPGSAWVEGWTTIYASREYVQTFYYKTSGTATASYYIYGNALILQADGTWAADLHEFTLPAAGDWTLVTKSFTTPPPNPGDISIYLASGFVLYGSEGEALWVDDVHVVLA